MVNTLTELVSIFVNLNFRKNRAEYDSLLGDADECLMRHFVTESGKSKGQFFYTPSVNTDRTCLLLQNICNPSLNLLQMSILKLFGFFYLFMLTSCLSFMKKLTLSIKPTKVNIDDIGFLNGIQMINSYEVVLPYISTSIKLFSLPGLRINLFQPSETGKPVCINKLMFGYRSQSFYGPVILALISLVSMGRFGIF